MFFLKQLLVPVNEKTKLIRTIVRFLLGAFLVFAGAAHLSFQRVEFLAQVPNWIPMDGNLVVVLSGVVEILLGLGLMLLPRYRVLLGWVTALFFILIFPGNISQYMNRVNAFGLNTDQARLIRLFFQPVLVIWVFWSTRAWADLPSVDQNN